jgi:hypothetical protein
MVESTKPITARAINSEINAENHPPIPKMSSQSIALVLDT